MVQSLIQLPDEILNSILCYSSPQSCAAIEQTHTRFRHVANEPLLWRHHCQSHYKYWDGRHELRQKLTRPVTEIDWKALFVYRYLVDRSVTRLLDGILDSQTGRFGKFRSVVDFGDDAKDTLLRHSRVESGEDLLARRYYARALLACFHRSIAVPEWAKLRRGDPMQLERALGCFDLFVSENGSGDLNEIRDALDGILQQFIASCANLTLLNPRAKALTVASWLQANNLTGIDSGREYHSLRHNFLGLALRTAGHNSLPLVSAAIYCCVARGVGLDAQLCGFPFHVHVIVMPQPGLDMDGNSLTRTRHGEPLYLDPFRGAREIPISALRNQLSLLGMPDLDQMRTLGKCDTSAVALRCAKNILNSVSAELQHAEAQPTSVDVVGAEYAAIWAIMLLSGNSTPMTLRRYLPTFVKLFTTDFPSDIFLVEEYIAPLFRGTNEHEHILERLRIMKAVDKTPRRVRKRSDGNRNIRYVVGQVFRHRRYDYKAIITGWDPECGAGEQEMMGMGTDRLEAGRNQSFYHVLVEDRSVRYVAEENIQLIKLRFTELPGNLTAIAGRHFKRWDPNNLMFVSNMKDEYPDD